MLGRVVLLVRDYDEALDFYRSALGAETLYDETDDGGQRFVHVGLPGQQDVHAELSPPTVGLWFLRATGEDAAAVGRQAGGHPFLVIYTPNCAASVTRFVEAGGELRRPEREEGGARFAHVADLYGNELVLVQLAG